MFAALNNYKKDTKHSDQRTSNKVNIVRGTNMEYGQLSAIKNLILSNLQSPLQSPLQSSNLSEDNIMHVDTDMNEANMNQSDSNNQTNSSNNSLNGLFEHHKDKILNVLSKTANKAFDNDDKDVSIYSFPIAILEYVHEYITCWRWSTHQSQVELSDDNQKMFVNNTNVSIFDRKCVGTACIGIDGIDNFCIDKNEVYLFEFNYISVGIGSLDAIIGIVDNNFEFTSCSLGVGNQINSFNWGFRSDGLLCANNNNINWDTDNLNVRMKNNDNICILLNTNNDKLTVQLYINNKCVYSHELTNLFSNISFPLKIMASAARGGGFQIIRGCKLQ
mmetsp:Transcript_21533/g.18978  ORF Transcript_21533/g.18978 Transcript_21533/m.18978 type:complete len:332 (+) Transcript_21533:65-1060(+)